MERRALYRQMEIRGGPEVRSTACNAGRAGRTHPQVRRPLPRNSQEGNAGEFCALTLRAAKAGTRRTTEFRSERGNHMHSHRSIHHPCRSHGLLTHDRRIDPRRACRATVWLLDDELLRAVEFGRAIDISRGGISLGACDSLALGDDSLRPGREWLVMLDDPTAVEPLADQRTAIIKLLRATRNAEGRLVLACAFASRSVSRCLPARKSDRGPDLDANSQVVAGDLLDELADRLSREIAAIHRAEGL